MRLSIIPAALLALVLALAPGLAFARAGGGSSFGSRGARTFSAPATTGTAPYSAAPFQRSLTPQAPAYAGQPNASARGYGSGFGGRPFVSGLMGGLIGVGLGGLLFGGGMFHGVSGFGGILGLLLQVFLVVMIGRWLWRKFVSRQPAMAGGAPLGGMFARAAEQPARTRPMPASTPSGTVPIGPADYQAFEQSLRAVQAGWSAHDLSALRQLATPEMVGYFAEQMAEQASRGVRNTVTDIRLDRGDLSEAWSEGGRDYATVAMRFSMVDVTRDGAGRLVDGSADEHVTATELWTFLRAGGGRWILSGIQQTR